jgi:putative membrane protein
MKTPGKLQLTAYSLGLVGAALFTALLVRQGVMSVGGAVTTAGWGIAAVAAFHLVPIFLDALAWGVLLPRAGRPPWKSLFWMRWIGESISNLVPSATVGGDIVRARLVAIQGVPLSTAAASIIVDITLGVVTQIVFTLLGLILLIDVTGRTNFVRPTLFGTLIGLVAVAGFYFAQRKGMFRFVGTIITRLVNSPEWSSLVEGGETLDQTVRALYGRRRGVLACCAWTIVSLVASSGEIWIALHALGLPATFVKAIILQSMAMTIRSVAFPVPGALGVQEGGYLVVGNLLGIPGEAAFAISLITRFRDLTLGIPGLVTWQLIEWHRFWRARSVLASR